MRGLRRQLGGCVLVWPMGRWRATTCRMFYDLRVPEPGRRVRLPGGSWHDFPVPVLLVIAIIVVLGAVVFLAMGRGGEMSVERNDYLPLDLGPVSATDVALLRPPTGLWGYNIQATDEAMEQIAESIRERDVRIVALEQLVTDLSRDHAPMTLLASPYAGARHRRTPADTAETEVVQAPRDTTATEQAGRSRSGCPSRSPRRSRPGCPSTLPRRSRPGCLSSRPGPAGTFQVRPRSSPMTDPAAELATSAEPGETARPKGPVAGPDGRLRCPWGLSAPEYVAYHDDEWGRPVHGDQPIFERLCLEAFQSGLSWLTILRKRENFRKAFAGFDIPAVAAFTDADVARLLADAGIVRNRAKINAAITNARAALELKEGLSDLVWSYADTGPRPAPRTLADLPAQTPPPRRWPRNCASAASCSPARSRSTPPCRPAA